MPTINGVLNKVNPLKSPLVINGTQTRVVNGLRHSGYDKWQMRWNGNQFAPPDKDSALYLPGVPGFGSTTFDYSGNGNDGTITGATWKRTGQGLWYLDFDGGDDLVTISDADSLSFITGGMTLIIWVNRDNDNRKDPLIVKYPTGDADNEYILSFESNGRLYFWVYDESETGFRGRYAPDFDSGTWRMVAATWDGGTANSGAKIYVDAIQTDTTDFSAAGFTAMENKDGDVLIGRATAGIVAYADCQLALPRIIARELAIAEIAGIRNQERHLFGV